MAREVRYKDLRDTLLLRTFGYSPKLRIIDIFLTNSYFDFSKEELVRELGMSKQTLYKNFKDLRPRNRNPDSNNWQSDNVSNQPRESDGEDAE